MIKLSKVNVVTGYRTEQINYFIEKNIPDTECLYKNYKFGAHESIFVELADTIIKDTSFVPIVIATFSEEFILRIRRRIAERKFKAEDFKLIIITEDNEYKESYVTQDGELDDKNNFPYGFFKTAYNDICAMRVAAREFRENKGE